MSTYKRMHQYVVQPSIVTQTANNLTHVITSTARNTEIDAKMSTKLANDTL